MLTSVGIWRRAASVGRIATLGRRRWPAVVTTARRWGRLSILLRGRLPVPRAISTLRRIWAI